jgi:hypothetical protein
MISASRNSLPLCGVLASGAFLVLCLTRIDGQGPYYDELFQVPAAFMLLGHAPYTFAPVSWENVPLLTMPYAGAAKSILYGLWMRGAGAPFSLVSWRVLGILLVCVGLLLFHAGARPGLTRAERGLFSALFLTDVTVLLTSRHDWGPTALSMALRLAWIGLWIRLESSDSVRRGELWLLGLLPTFSIYEKLNNATFLVPLALAGLFSPALRAPAPRLHVLAGALAGLLPLLWINTLVGGISIQALLDSTGPSRSTAALLGLPQFFRLFLELGAGADARAFILGQAVSLWVEYSELASMTGLLSAAALMGLRRGTTDRAARLALVSTLAYVLTGILTHFLPSETWIHHWIAATPFQYVAMSLLPGLARRAWTGSSPKAWPRAPVLVLLACLLLARGVNLWETEHALARGMTGPSWDPSYATIARFAIDHRDRANFVLADWGFATSIYAFSNGSFRISEPFWDYREPTQLRTSLCGRPGRPVYVIARRLDFPVNPAATEAIIRDLGALTEGRTLPVESEVADLRSVLVLKFPHPDSSARASDSTDGRGRELCPRPRADG